MTARNWHDAKEFIAKLAVEPRFGLCSDLDGTLSPIALSPEAAQITARNRELLAELQKELPLLGLISGRRAGSLHGRVGLEGLVYIGNHGLERWTDNGVQILPDAQRYMNALQEAKNELQKIEELGVYVEDKGPTLSLHYRQAAQPMAFSRDKAAWIAGVAEKHGLVLFTGKMVFEIRPPVDMDKGIVFQQLLKDNGIEAALFLGDDVSDLNALKVARRLREERVCDAWGVGVQSLDAPESLAETADFLAEGVEDIEDLLAWVLKARKASST